MKRLWQVLGILGLAGGCAAALCGEAEQRATVLVADPALTDAPYEHARYFAGLILWRPGELAASQGVRA